MTRPRPKLLFNIVHIFYQNKRLSVPLLCASLFLPTTILTNSKAKAENRYEAVQQNELERDHATRQPPLEKFYVLYLENTGTNPELYNLISRVKRKKKLVLQFNINATGDTLTLYALPVNKSRGVIRFNRGELYSNDRKQLSISKAAGDELKGRKVVLGALQLEKEDLKNLRKYMVQKGGTNKNGYEYILFVPDIRKDSLTEQNYVYYKITHSAEVPKKDIEDKSNLAELAFANPSPPRKPY